MNFNFMNEKESCSFVDFEEPEILPICCSWVSLFQLQFQWLFQSFRTGGFCMCKWIHSRRFTALDQL